MRHGSILLCITLQHDELSGSVEKNGMDISLMFAAIMFHKLLQMRKQFAKGYVLGTVFKSSGI